MGRWLIRIGVMVAVVAIAWVARLTVFAPEPVSVSVHRVGRGRVEETVTNTRAGTVKARRRAKLSPEYGGTVTGLPFHEGDWVDKDAVVLRLDDSLQQARLALAKRDLQAAQAKHNQACLGSERAERERARIFQLEQEEIVSADLFDQVQSTAQTLQAACEAAQASWERARAAVGLSEVELAKQVLRAPFAGLVAEVSIEIGEWTTPSPPALPVPPVIDILDPSSIYVAAPMDEVDSARISREQAVRVTVDSHRGLTFPGTVSRVSVYVLDIEAQNRTVEIDVDLDDPELASTLLPGTSADVEVILQVREETLRIPTSALFEGDRVLVVQGELLVERQVEAGLKNWNFTEVLRGLGPGEAVVSSLDRPEIKNGAKVRVVEETGSNGVVEETGSNGLAARRDPGRQ